MGQARSPPSTTAAAGQANGFRRQPAGLRRAERPGEIVARRLDIPAGGAELGDQLAVPLEERASTITVSTFDTSAAQTTAATGSMTGATFGDFVSMITRSAFLPCIFV
jgi:hypothetical protein